MFSYVVPHHTMFTQLYVIKNKDWNVYVPITNVLSFRNHETKYQDVILALTCVSTLFTNVLRGFPNAD